MRLETNDLSFHMNFLKRFQFARDSYTVTALVVGIALLLNLIASNHFVRTDLTRGQLYAISPETKAMMGSLEDLVTVKVFFSSKLPPNLFAVKQYVDDILEEMSSYSKGRLVVENLNPDTPEVAQEAVNMGIPQIQMNIIDRDKLEVKNGFLGIAVTYGDKKEILPVVQTPLTVEYDLAAAIKKATAEQQKVVGFVIGHEEPTLAENLEVSSTGEGFSLFRKSLERNYVVREVTLDKDDLSEIDTLILAGARKPYSDKEKAALDQFLMKGKNVLAFLDTIVVGQDLKTSAQDLGLEDQFASYGAKIEKSLALDRSNEMATFNQGYMSFVVPYPFWIKTAKAFADPASAIVNKLESVVFPWTSPITLTPAEGITAQSLLKTTPNAWTQSEPFNLAPNQVQPPTERNTLPLAILLRGKFQSFLKGQKAAAKIPDFQEQASKDSVLMVVGNSRFILDRFVGQFPQNLAFAMNAVDDLTLDQSLIGIRSKTSFDLPLKDLSATERSLVKWIGIFLMPFLVILFGLARLVLRRKPSLS